LETSLRLGLGLDQLSASTGVLVGRIVRCPLAHDPCAAREWQQALTLKRQAQ